MNEFACFSLSKPLALKIGFVFEEKFVSFLGGGYDSADFAACKNVFITALIGIYFVLEDILANMLKVISYVVALKKVKKK